MPNGAIYTVHIDTLLQLPPSIILWTFLSNKIHIQSTFVLLNCIGKAKECKQIKQNKTKNENREGTLCQLSTRFFFLLFVALHMLFYYILYMCLISPLYIFFLWCSGKILFISTAYEVCVWKSALITSALKWNFLLNNLLVYASY